MYLKPEYTLHAFISGNKFRKLRYNIEEAKALKHHRLLTFGGAYSNHLAAVAAAGKIHGFSTVGIVRGEELETVATQNPTLQYCRTQGMQLHFVDRATYRTKGSREFTDYLHTEFGDFYLLPEGGTNAPAVKGCEEILTAEDAAFDYICCPVGTGGTLAGISNSAGAHQKILGFPALKGDFLNEAIRLYTQKTNWELVTDYHFGGYAKINPSLIAFINWFKTTYTIPLDPVYTGKMMYGVFDLLRKGYFAPDTKILVIHTGGLQGISGMNQVLKQRGLPHIE